MGIAMLEQGPLPAKGRGSACVQIAKEEKGVEWADPPS
jgi:hypothetical protein